MGDYSSIVAAGISAAGSLIGSNVSSKKAYRHTKWLQDRQNQYNVANWKMENEYNSPINVMARYREAGLNPYTAMSDGSGFSGEVGSVGLPNTPPTDNGIERAGMALSSLPQNVESLRAIRNDNESKELDNSFKRAYQHLDAELKKHNISNAAYNSDIALMQRNHMIFTFSDNLLTTFLERDWRNRMLKNETAKLIQEGSALEDVLGLKMTENRGWSNGENGIESTTNFGPAAWSGKNLSNGSLDYERKAENNYYNFLYRGSKDKNNPIYNAFKQQFENQFTDAIMRSIEVGSAHDLNKKINMANIVKAGNDLADLEFDHAMRNGFEKADWHVALYRSIKGIESFLGNNMRISYDWKYQGTDKPIINKKIGF